MRHRRGSLALLLLAACSAPEPAALSLSLSEAGAPADGLTRVRAVARATGLAPTAVVSFELAGPGLLSTTQARVEDGIASAEIYAPFEAELTGAQATATVTARSAVELAVIEASAALTFTLPTGGAPSLSALVTPDRVRAGGPDPITLVVEGRRLTDTTVALQSDNPALTLPQSLTLQADGPLARAELRIDAPAEPMTVVVTVTGGGAPPASATLRFIGDDEAAFDVTGTFAQISYSVVEIGGLVFLDPDPQCVVAPTLALVRATQTGDQVTLESELCDIQMPSVNVVFIGASRTWVDPSFVAAMNDADGGPLTMTVGADGAFSPDVASLPPVIVGATLPSPTAPLPTSGDDPRAHDGDGDGHPGVTVHNSTQGDQYTASRTRALTMIGRVESSDALDGTQTATTETVIYNGGSGGLSPRVTPKSSPFHMRRVDGQNTPVNIAPRDGDASSVSCADVRAYAAELMALAAGPDPTQACR